MKEYNVRLPIAGILSVIVEAESEEEAIKEALGVDWQADVKGKNVELEEIEAYSKLFEGNVTHVWHYEAEAIELPGS